MSWLAKWLESLHVDFEMTTKCSRKRNLHSSCSYCLDACQTGAIIIEQQKLIINKDLCNNCGSCMISCPLSAIEGISLLRSFENGCLQYNEQYNVTEKELLIYKKNGIGTIAAIGPILNQQWMSAFVGANQKLQLLGKSVMGLQINTDEKEFSRRELFAFLKKQGRQLTKGLSPAAWKIESDKWVLNQHFPEHQFFTVHVDIENCNVCQACYHICTQNVFTMEGPSLWIHHDKCVNCTDCVDICPESAIKITSEIKKKTICHLSLYYQVCQKCGTSYPSFNKTSQECHICSARDPKWLSPFTI